MSSFERIAENNEVRYLTAEIKKMADDAQMNTELQQVLIVPRPESMLMNWVQCKEGIVATLIQDAELHESELALSFKLQS